MLTKARYIAATEYTHTRQAPFSLWAGSIHGTQFPGHSTIEKSS
jgi:hypothetical protein